MAGSKRQSTDRLELYAAIQAQPHAFDFYQAMRRIEGLHPELPRLGESLSPGSEPVRLGQEPLLTFAPANLSSAGQREDGTLQIWSRFLGLFGPQGPLPIHLSDYAHERKLDGDRTFASFADLFHHRLLLFFYRAWRQAQPTASRDHPGNDRFADFVSALIGRMPPQWRDRDLVQDDAKRFFSGHLARNHPNEAGLAAILGAYYSVPVHINSYHPSWIRLEPEEQTRLGGGAYSLLGRNTVLGGRVFDAQHGIEVRFGPMSLKRYESMLPGGASLARLRDWIHNYLGATIWTKITLVLDHREVPPPKLGKYGRLGLNTWIGKRRSTRDADDLSIGSGRLASVSGAAAQPTSSTEGVPNV